MHYLCTTLKIIHSIVTTFDDVYMTIEPAIADNKVHTHVTHHRDCVSANAATVM